jgi:hypothetical protein
VELCNGPYACAEDADALVIVTEWEQFRALDFDRLRDVMAAPVIIDLRNVYRPEDVTSRGFIYYSIGRPQSELPKGALGHVRTEAPALASIVNDGAVDAGAEEPVRDTGRQREPIDL